MKTVNFFIVALLMGVLIISCGKKEEAKENTTPKVQSRDMGELKIAFYNSDSLKKYFDYYREQDSIVTKKQLSFQKEVERRSKEYQGFIMRKEEEARSGLLSQNELMQVQQKAQQMEAELMKYQQGQGAGLEEETMKKLPLPRRVSWAMWLASRSSWNNKPLKRSTDQRPLASTSKSKVPAVAVVPAAAPVLATL